VTRGQSAVRERVLFFGDLVLVLLAAYVGPLLRFGEPINVFRTYTGATLIFVFSFLSSFYIAGLFNIEELSTGTRTLLRLIGASAVATLLSSTLFYFSPHYRYGRGIFVLAALLMVLFAYGWRLLAHSYWRAFVRAVPTLVIGTGRSAGVIHRLVGRNHSEYSIVGFVQTQFKTAAAANPDSRARGGLSALGATAEVAVPDSGVVGGMSALGTLVKEHNIGCLVVASDVRELSAEHAGVLTETKFSGVYIFDSAAFYMRIAEALPLELLDESWLWFAEGFDLLQAQLARKVKRLSDVVLSFAGLVLSLPLGLLAILAIKLDSPGPVFYRQMRVGLQGKMFELVKFRSMRVDAEAAGGPQCARVNDDRVTRVGLWIRKMRIDEIPQMINVLKGDMSFIGPRPERPEFVKQFKGVIPFYGLRHYVHPGITGWAQVNYPYGATVEDAKRKLEYDLYYVVKASLFLDLRILLRTVRIVLFQVGSR